MLLRRLLPVVGILAMLVLAGCFRQSGDTFDTVPSDNSNGEEITITQEQATATTVIIEIDPNATTGSDEDENNTVVEPTATRRIILPSSTPVATEESVTVPTATQAGFVTPQVEVQATIPTATASPVSGNTTLQSTPAVSGTSGSSEIGANCQYTIQGGDTLFRIALSNNITLAALLEANNLAENSIIQPGQTIIIPDCNSEEETSTTTGSTIEETEIEAIPGSCDYVVQPGDALYTIALSNGVALADLLALNELTENSIIQPNQILKLPDCEDLNATATPDNVATSSSTLPESTVEPEQVLHTVASGETWLSIAQLYGVTVNAIIQENSITNPNNLSPGMVLVIPQQ